MAEISRVTLVRQAQQPSAYKAIESATVFCKLRGNPYVELVHWLAPDPAAPGLRPAPHHPALRPRHRGRWPRTSPRALDRLPRGATSISDLSAHIDGRGGARLGLRHPDVRRAPGAHRPSDGGHAQDAGRCATPCSTSRASSSKIKRRRPGRATSAKIVAGSPEDRAARHRRLQVGGGAAPGEASGAMAPAADGQAGGPAALHRGPHRAGAQAASSIPSSGATRRSARSSTSSCAAARTTRS
ncbi:MAG: hypothetical protein MZV65_48175 [Chromatiales bacterium]|nr:hypothetical protein [Chromatiales bacterium]